MAKSNWCNRFYLAQAEETFWKGDKRIDKMVWQCIDSKYELCLSCGNGTKKDALSLKSFAIAYVKVHGDINFESFPFSIDEPLTPYEAEGVA